MIFLKIWYFFENLIFENLIFSKIWYIQKWDFPIRYPHFEQLSRITHKKCRKTAGTGVKLYLIVIFQHWNLLSWEIRQIPIFNPREGPVFVKSDPLGPGNGTRSEKNFFGGQFINIPTHYESLFKKYLAFLAKNEHFKISLLFPGSMEAKFQSPRGTKINVNYEKKFHRSVL